MEILLYSLQLASLLSVFSGVHCPPCRAGVNPCNSNNFGTIIFLIEIAHVKLNFDILPNISTHTACPTVPVTHVLDSILRVTNGPASLFCLSIQLLIAFSRTWAPYALQCTKNLVHTLCLCFTGNVFLIAHRVIKLKNRVGPSPMELALEFFYPES